MITKGYSRKPIGQITGLTWRSPEKSVPKEVIGEMHTEEITGLCATKRFGQKTCLHVGTIGNKRQGAIQGRTHMTIEKPRGGLSRPAMTGSRGPSICRLGGIGGPVRQTAFRIA